MNIDRARIAAVRTLEAAGYTYEGGELWKPPLGKPDTRDTLARLSDATLTLNRILLSAGLCKPPTHIVLDGPNDLTQLNMALRSSPDWNPYNEKRHGNILLCGVTYTYEIPF